MLEEEKQLLLRDLCARLPYGVKFNYGGYDGCDYKVEIITSTFINDFPIEDCKPYLRPLSSMTEEEKKELGIISCDGNIEHKYGIFYRSQDYLNAHHFDYRGLIEKGLAIEAPKGMYDYD